ncbi:MAG: hypothetical protein ACJA0G_001678 [Kangiellaceae bacterium]|jgi:hypothetical protein
MWLSFIIEEHLSVNVVTKLLSTILYSPSIHIVFFYNYLLLWPNMSSSTSSAFAFGSTMALCIAFVGLCIIA